MTKPEIEIRKYVPQDHSELVRLLLELHTTHFIQTASPQMRELEQDHDIHTSYDQYVTSLDENTDGDWLALMARSGEQVVGFIIGSIASDPALVFNKVGKFEDWFVEPTARGMGIGSKLFRELEKWFLEKGCKQIQSDTWQGNDISIKAHKQLGFFISGIRFSKKL